MNNQITIEQLEKRVKVLEDEVFEANKNIRNWSNLYYTDFDNLKKEISSLKKEIKTLKG